MKRIALVVLYILLAASLCACGGSRVGIELKERSAIPESGIISCEVFEQIRLENAVCVFYGNSNGYDYEWTIFGTDIDQAADTNLHVSVESADGDIRLGFAQEGSFAFDALLSVYLNETWNALGATVFSNGYAIAQISLTGSDNTILNYSLKKIPTDCVIRANEHLETPAPAQTSSSPAPTDSPVHNSAYLSSVTSDEIRVYSDGSAAGKDQYLTDPIPAGMPLPVEPQNQVVNSSAAYTCTLSIECASIFNNLSMLNQNKLELLPAGGIILPPTTVSFYEGESVFDVLQRVCRDYGIHMEASWTPIYNSAYIEGIHNLYEFDCGSLSGWMYRVNGWYPNYGCSRYSLAQGDMVEWRYTCDLGNDIGGGQLFR